MSIDQIITYAISDITFNSLIYIIFALPAFIIFWVWGKKFFKARRIQEKKRARSKNINREILFSAMSLAIFCIIDSGIFVAAQYGYTQIYLDPAKYSWWYWGFSVGLMMILHDAYFYWAHRWMHHPLIYKHVHKIHHESIDPSPFAAFSFHPLETIVEAGFYVIFVFLCPIHLVAIIVWQVLQQGLNVIGHMGYEIYPANFTRHWLFKWKTPSTHHNMHHSDFNGNFGLYFTWWDKWCGTEFDHYHETYDNVQERIKAAKEQSQMEAINQEK